MLKAFQNIMALLFKTEKEHKHDIIDQEKVKLQRKLTASQRDYAALTARHDDVTEQMKLWIRQSEQLQDKLSAALAHVKVLEGVLIESNITIESLQLSLDLREKEETEGLQNYIDELETEIAEAVELIHQYGLQMRKV